MTGASLVEHGEAVEYYRGYISQAGEGDIVALMKRQPAEVAPFLRGISEEKSLHRYAPDKWSIREVLSHINDAERVFSHRAYWFSRGFESPLPSFDQDIAVAATDADARSWASHVDEFLVIRAANIPLFENLTGETWSRRGVASGNPFSVRALAYIIVGHANHHLRVLRERYLQL